MFALGKHRLLDEIRRGTTAVDAVPDELREAARAWRALFDEAGVDVHTVTPRQARLSPFMPPVRVAPWPLVVSHPLGLLHISLGRATTPEHPAWAAATLLLRDAAQDLLERIMRRYERVSTLLTSKHPVDGCGKLLGNDGAVTAPLDRLLHYAHVLKCRPRSWRTKLQPDLRQEEAKR